MKFFISGHRADQAADVAKKLRALGHVITSTWHDEPPTAPPLWPSMFGRGGADKLKKTEDNFAQIDAADAVVMIVSDERVPGGKFVEQGYALGKGKPVVLYGENYDTAARRENLYANAYGVELATYPGQVFGAAADGRDALDRAIRNRVAYEKSPAEDETTEVIPYETTAGKQAAASAPAKASKPATGCW